MDTKNETEPEADRLLEMAEELIEEAETLLEEVVDLEECAKAGRRPPLAKAYRFKVNETLVIWHSPTVTPREALTAAKLVPPDDYRVRLKVAGEKPQPIDLDAPVDLRRPGLEKFRAIKKGQGEGEAQGRRDAPTLDHDRAFLDSYATGWECIQDGSIWILIYNFALPPGYSETYITLAIRIEGGYPLSKLDMFYVFPRIHRADGKPVRQADVVQRIDGKDFQRWSRHRTPDNPWVAGQDSIETHIYLVEEALAEELTK